MAMLSTLFPMKADGDTMRKIRAERTAYLKHFLAQRWQAQVLIGQPTQLRNYVGRAVMFRVDIIQVAHT